VEGGKKESLRAKRGKVVKDFRENSGKSDRGKSWQGSSRLRGGPNEEGGGSLRDSIQKEKEQLLLAQKTNTREKGLLRGRRQKGREKFPLERGQAAFSLSKNRRGGPAIRARENDKLTVEGLRRKERKHGSSS